MTDLDYNNCVTQYADNVYRFIIKNLRHNEDANDIVQSSFEKLWINRRQVDYLTCKSYLFTIAYNQMIDHIRKQKKIIYKEQLDTNSLISNNEQNQLKSALNQALTLLNDTQRSLVLLKDYEGYSYTEIAEIMDLNESQVKVYLHRARIILKNYLIKIENVN